MSWSKAAVLALLVIICAAAVFFVKTRPITSQSSAQIVLTDKGFEPQEVYVRKGGSVTFITAAGKQFWPASNNHPNHTIYPEFDPKRPLQPGESWTFQFDRIGDWGFHDHIRSYFVGIIHVTP